MVKYNSIYVLIVLLSLYDLELEKIDVKMTFLHCDLEEMIYIQQPEGFVIPKKENHVYLLKKLLYGLK